MQTNNFKFLIGGSDLEMLEIKVILDKYKQPYLDNNLKWDNAKWFAYADHFEKAENHHYTYVGIELAGKENRPENSVDIDHHNEKHEDKSALEQVIELLEIPEEWTRRRQLIAANDKGHIKAMKSLNATDTEIAEIRLADRRAQGATEEDEQKAQRSLEKYSKTIEGVKIVFALTERFSCIVDRLYGDADKILVFNHSTLNYYGDITQLKGEFDEEIKNGRAYYGGDLKSGYFGLAKGQWCSKDMEETIPHIINSVNKTITQEKSIEDEINLFLRELPEKMHSYHIFLFPFKWKRNGQKGAYQPSEFDALIRPDSLQNGKWKKRPFNCLPDFDSSKKIASGWDHFNEYSYFYDHVRKMLYELDETCLEPGEVQFMRHYEYELADDNVGYQILLRNENDKDAKDLTSLNATYSLVIDTIILNVYRTGTAVLSFHLRNHDYSDPEDILKINLFGRRISVPFLGMESDSIFSGSADHSHLKKGHDPLQLTKKTEIPNAIWLGKSTLTKAKGPKQYIPFYEDFSAFRNSENYQNSTFLLPNFIKDLFSNHFLTQSHDEGKIKIAPVLDDRMHVISWYGNSKLIGTLNKHIRSEGAVDRMGVNQCIKTLKERSLNQSYSYEISDWWYKYLYVDTGVMQTDRFVRVEKVREQTYSRFVEWGTLYGISRYSFVMTTGDFSRTPDYLVRHLQSMYYKMVELCLLQRATILKFSEAAARLSQKVFELDNNPENKTTADKITTEIKLLYRRYIFFVNRIYFREVTPQEQGIELYDLLQQTMRIPQEVKNLDEEIRELNAFVNSVNEERKGDEQHKLAKKADLFTRYAAFFLGPTLLAGIVGMNTVPSTWANGNGEGFMFSILLVVGIGVCVGVFLLKLFESLLNEESNEK